MKTCRTCGVALPDDCTFAWCVKCDLPNWQIVPPLPKSEDLRWRRTLEEPPPWRTRVLVRAQWSWCGTGDWWYDVTTYERMPYAPFRAAWRGDCGWAEPGYYIEWRPLP